MASSPSPPWSELPPDILGLVINRVPFAAARPRRPAWSLLLLFWSACSWLLRALLHSLTRFPLPAAFPLTAAVSVSVDRAHFRAAYRSWRTATRFRAVYHAHRTVEAVCRSWRAAVREHLPCPPRHLPWILANDSLITSSKASSRRFHYLPKNATCIGSTNDWIALRCVVADDAFGSYNYLLHNPFSNTTVPLPELDNLIGNNVSMLFEVRKVLMRSTPRDVVAVMTNDDKYPIILLRPGKGVWLPKPQSAPFIFIIDIVFIGERLYGITQAEDLISVDIAFSAEDVPTVTRTKRIIRHPPKAGDRSDVWSNVDLFRVTKFDDGYDLWSDVDEKYHKYDVRDDKGEQDLKTLNEEHDNDHAQYIIMRPINDLVIGEGIHYDTSDGLFITTWQIVESLGKLVMVRRKLQWLSRGNYTRKADVFEADITKGVWVPVTNGLHGQTLFISRHFCKAIHASGEVEKDVVYFVDTGEVLNMKSKIISQPKRKLCFRESTWLFLPEPVVS